MIDDRLSEMGGELRAAVTRREFDGSIDDGLSDVHRRVTRRKRHRRIGAVAVMAIVLAGSVAAFTATRESAQHVATGRSGVRVGDSEQIREALSVLFEPGHTVDDKLGVIQGSGDLRGVIVQGTQDPRAGSVALEVTSVELRGDKATAHIDFFLDGAPALTGATLELVRTDGRWLVVRASYCALIASTGPTCPGSAGATNARPTTSEISAVMSRTIPDDAPDAHFQPADDPVVVGDGAGGTLTAVIGVRTDTGDGGGQLVFFWHDDTFIGWSADHESFKLAARPTADDRIAVDYGWIRAGEAACCASGLATIEYGWNGTGLQPDRPLPAEATGGTHVHLTQ